MSHTYYTLNNETIVLTSVNKKTIDHLSSMLSGVTSEDIKSNRVIGRVRLMKMLSCAGNCPLAEEYYTVRGKINTELDTLSSKHTKLSTYATRRAEIAESLIEKYFSETGWSFYMLRGGMRLF